MIGHRRRERADGSAPSFTSADPGNRDLLRKLPDRADHSLRNTLRDVGRFLLPERGFAEGGLKSVLGLRNTKDARNGFPGRLKNRFQTIVRRFEPADGLPAT